jgi:hypothetical protein
MGRKKKVITDPKETETASVPVEDILKKLEHASVDFGREDLNNLARKVNEIIDVING